MPVQKHPEKRMDMSILQLEQVSMNFGALKALSGVCFEINQEILGLIGPNGSGQTTLINCITGVYKPSAGTIRLGDQSITQLKPHQIFRAGIARTFQIPRPFHRMTVRENVLVAAKDVKAVDESIAMVGLEEKSKLPASKLTFPELRKLEIARALAGKPKLLLLDEAISGLNPTESAQMVNLVKDVHRRTGVAILWIEHVMQAVMENTSRMVVLNQGMKLAEGLPQQLAEDEKVIEVYLGKKYEFKG
jgi:branched-chain amino acid transport system ATP-binding protein